MTHKVLIINLGWEQRPLIKYLIESNRNLKLYGIHSQENIGYMEEFVEVLVSDLRDLQSIIQFADRIRPNAVIADECDYALFAQALLCERYSLPGPSILAAQKSNNKIFQREVAFEKKIRVPEFRRCYSHEDVWKFGDSIGWPIIVKPNDNRGSYGVSVIRDPSEVHAASTRALANSHSRTMIAERCINGQHLTIDGFCSPGQRPMTLALGSNTKFDTGQRTINESIVYPGHLTPERYSEAWELAENVAWLLGYDFGLFHGEFIVEDQTSAIYLTEMSNRGGGVHISNISVPFVSGLDVYKYYIDSVLGDSAVLQINKPNGRQLQMRFFYESNLVGRKAPNPYSMESDLDMPEVMCAKIFPNKLNVFAGIKDGVNRHGMIIVGSEAEVDILSLTTQALDRFRSRLSNDKL